MRKLIEYKGSVYVPVTQTAPVPAKKGKKAGYKGEKEPVAPKGPAIDPTQKKAPFAPKDSRKVEPVTKAVPSTLVPGKMGKKK